MMGLKLTRLFFVAVLTLCVAGFYSMSINKESFAGKKGTSSASGWSSWAKNNDGSSDDKSSDDGSSGHGKKKKPKKEWRTAGNKNIDQDKHFLGTTDEADLVIKTNNTEKARVTTDGNVGIGTGSPTGILHVEGGEAAADTDGTNVTIKAQDGGPTSGVGGNIILTPGSDGDGTSTGTVYVGEIDSLDPPTLTLDVNGQIRIRGGSPVIGAVLTSDSFGNASWMSVNVNDDDSDPTNELNTEVSLIGTKLYVTDAGGAKFADLLSLVDDADSDPANERNVSVVINGTILDITDSGGTISTDLSSLVDDADADPANELQNLSSTASGTNRTIAITDGTDTTISVADNDDDDENEIQTLSFASPILSIVNGNTVDLSSLNDTDWTENDGNVFRTNGNVGIGTSAPGAGLTVANGRAQFSGNTLPTSGGGLELGYTSGIGGVIASFDRSASTMKQLQLMASFIQFKTSGNEAMRIDENHNIGIGTVNPGEKLDVTGNIAVSGTVDGVDILSHAGNVDAHHSRYTDTEAVNAVGPHTTDTDDQNLSAAVLTGTLLQMGIEDGTGTSVDLASLQDGTGTDDQQLSFAGTTLSLEDGGSADLSSLQDGTGTDDQNLSAAVLTGTLLQMGIEDGIGTSVDLASLQDGTGTDDQQLSFAGTTLSLEDGGSADLSGLQDGTGTDDQNLTGATLTGTTLQVDIEGGTSASVDLVGLQDGTGTDDQQLSFAGTTLSLEDGGSVDLNSLGDETDPEVGTISPDFVPKWDGISSSLISGSIFDNGNVGIGTTNPTEKLHVEGKVKIGTTLEWNNTSGTQMGTIDTAADTYGYLRLNDAGSTKVLIRGSGSGVSYFNGGNVGIGTSSPASRLSIGTSTLNPPGDILISGTVPQLFFERSAEPVNGRLWDFVLSGPEFHGRLINDANNSGTEWLRVKRTGMSVNSVSFPSGNVGIGTISPGGLLGLGNSSTYLGVSGNNLTFTDGSGIGTKTLTELASGSLWTDNGTYINANNAANVVVSDTGRVGIGTLAPSTRLHVSAPHSAYITLESTGIANNEATFTWLNNQGMSLLGLAGAAGELLDAVTSAGDLALSHRTGGKIILSADSNHAEGHLAIQENGNVGIGTTSPDVNLDVEGTNAIMELHATTSNSNSARIKLWRASESYYNEVNNYGMWKSGDDMLIDTKTSHSILFRPNSTEAMRIDNNGNVGIGATSPGSRLHVESATDEVARFQDDLADHIAFIRVGSQFGSGRFGTYGNYPAILRNASDYAYYYDTNNNMSILAGKVGIGTTNPLSALHVKMANATPLGGIVLEQNDNSNTTQLITASGEFQINTGTAGGGSTQRFVIRHSDGAVFGTYGTYHAPSDFRLKKDITTIPDALDKVTRLRGVNYKWKDESFDMNSIQMGLIAQEVEKVIPEVVHVGDDEMKTKSVEYQYLVALLIEAVKDLKNENDVVKKDSTILKSENEQLRQELLAIKDRQSAIEDMLFALSTELPKDKLAKLGIAR